MAETFQVITGLSETTRSELSEAARNQQEARSKLSETARSELGEHQLNFVITFHKDRSNNEPSKRTTKLMDENLTDDMIFKIIKSVWGCPICDGTCCPTRPSRSFLEELDKLGGNEFDLGMAVFDTHTRPILFLPEQGKMPDRSELLGRITKALLDAQSAVTSTK